jgi:hypothetical protein
MEWEGGVARSQPPPRMLGLMVLGQEAHGRPPVRGLGLCISQPSVCDPSFSSKSASLESHLGSWFW